ncbi:uncharacterized protein LOC144642355 [Oculina patagonica]
MEHHFFLICAFLIFFATAVRGLNITRCLGPYNDTYTCPRLSDPPERTHCCLWNNQPTCCLPGGSSCSDSADKRNYCPRPDDENERTHCCVWDSQPTCCLPGGSSCSDKYAEIRNYCPGPNDGKNDRDCCADGNENALTPTCCRDKSWIVYGLLGFFFGVVPLAFCISMCIGYLYDRNQDQ